MSVMGGPWPKNTATFSRQSEGLAMRDYSLTALLSFSGEDVCLQYIQGKNYNFKTENVITLFTNYNVNCNIVWIFVSLDFRPPQIARPTWVISGASA